MPNYTQENARTRSVNDARVSGRKVLFLPRWSHTIGKLPNGQWPPFRDLRRPTHPLLYLELPRGQPIRIRTEGQQPRRDWWRRGYPRKESVHGERDSRVGEDKETIKVRTSSKTGLSYWLELDSSTNSNKWLKSCLYL